MTPFHMAVEYSHLDICKIILEDSFPKNKAGKTPFELAEAQGKEEIVNLIASYGLS